MRVTAVVLLVLLPLLALAPQAAGASVVELAFGSAGVVSPAVIPFNFGNQALGSISDLIFTVCFKQPASPASVCDASGAVSLQQNLDSPHFLHGGTFLETVATGNKVPANFPVNLASGQRLVVLDQFVPGQLGGFGDTQVLRGTPTGGSSETITLDLTGTGVAPGPCVPGSQVLCLNNDRFKVQSHFLTSSFLNGKASGIELTSETGYQFFFSSTNVESVIKVLNACTFNTRYWVFAGGLTDVRTVITVTDTQKNAVKTYVNPLGKAFQPIQDTSAFATCP